MSANFVVTYRGRPVRFTYTAGRMVYEIVAADQASPFLAAADGWYAAYQHGMRPDFCDVVPAAQLSTCNLQPAAV
jgi:hypothetical protein